MSISASRRRAWIVLGATLAAAAGAKALKPTRHLSEELGPLNLERSIPKTFGAWQEDTRLAGGVVNPQQVEQLRRIYSETLSRTYQHRDGYRVMLSIAYGGDQSDGLQVHYPDVCYPAQGFRVMSRQRVTLETPFGVLPAVRLETALGDSRLEPLTYWVTVGQEAVSTAVGKKLAEMRHTLLERHIPDGLLLRVSSIDGDSAAAFERQRIFALDLLAALPVGVRPRVAGLGNVPARTQSG